jgi:hypothetical protein
MTTDLLSRNTPNDPNETSNEVFIETQELLIGFSGIINKIDFNQFLEELDAVPKDIKLRDSQYISKLRIMAHGLRKIKMEEIDFNSDDF